MAKLQEIDYSTTFSNNTDVDNQSTLGSAPADTINEIMQKMMKLRAAAITRHVTKINGTYTAAKTDAGQLWRCTGAVTINLTAAATLTDGWSLWVRANGGPVRIDPNGTEQIDGNAQTLEIADGMMVQIICTGTAFFTVMMGTSLVSNVAGSAPGPILSLFKDATLIFDDQLGRIQFTGRNSVDSIKSYIGIVAITEDATAGSEDASLLFETIKAGTASTRMTVSPTGVRINGLLDLSGTDASQIKFSSSNNSANVNTLDGYTDFIPSTPTLVGFGTPTAVSYFSKRVGDALHAFVGFTAGTATAVEARIPLLLDGVALTSDATKIPAIITCGTAITNTNTATFFGVYPLIESGVTYMTLGFQASTGNAFTKATGTGIGTGNKVGLVAVIPISGW